jgi:nucleoside-diphosphate-sugar epimerase
VIIMTKQKTALVLGATGGIGGEAATALLQRGWRVIAMTRTSAPRRESRASGRLAAVEWVTGDAMRPADVLKAAEGVQAIIHAVNPPGYRNWGELVLPMIDNSIAAAKKVHARLVLPGTIYNYGNDAFPLLKEDSPQHPLTEKGRIRVELERRLEDASREGVRVLIVRFGDFFGPSPGNNWFSQGLVKPGRPLTTITYPGKPGVGHGWAYLPDAAETVAQLLDREDDLEQFARFHFEGHWDADGTLMTRTIADAVGRPGTKISRLPWWLLRLAGLIQQTPRELVKMRYLWETPIRLDNHKLVAFLGQEPRTDLRQAVTNTLDALAVS